jgi:hypothetical protein
MTDPRTIPPLEADEVGRHNGHADLLRERLDGSVGS